MGSADTRVRTVMSARSLWDLKGIGRDEVITENDGTLFLWF